MDVLMWQTSIQGHFVEPNIEFPCARLVFDLFSDNGGSAVIVVPD